VGGIDYKQDPGAAEVLTGNAILSKYALSDFQILRFSRQNDWYKEENRKSLPLPEKVTRGVAQKAFGVSIDEKEVRAPVPYGGRGPLRVLGRQGKRDTHRQYLFRHQDEGRRDGRRRRRGAGRSDAGIVVPSPGSRPARAPGQCRSVRSQACRPACQTAS
jgi:hypothetical protein